MILRCRFKRSEVVSAVRFLEELDILWIDPYATLTYDSFKVISGLELFFEIKKFYQSETRV